MERARLSTIAAVELRHRHATRSWTAGELGQSLRMFIRPSLCIGQVGSLLPPMVRTATVAPINITSPAAGTLPIRKMLPILAYPLLVQAFIILTLAAIWQASASW